MTAPKIQLPVTTPSVTRNYSVPASAPVVPPSENGALFPPLAEKPKLLRGGSASSLDALKLQHQQQYASENSKDADEPTRPRSAKGSFDLSNFAEMSPIKGENDKSNDNINNQSADEDDEFDAREHEEDWHEDFENKQPEKLQVIRKLVDLSRKKHNPTPTRWKEFAADVYENYIRFEKFPFLRLMAHYDAFSCGPFHSSATKGYTPLELLFKFYSSRQDVTSAGLNADPTFDDIQKANDSMSPAEFLKMVHDMIPMRIQRSDLLWIFNTTAMERRQLDPEADISEVNVDDFARLLVRLALMLWNDGKKSHGDCVRELCQMLKLGDYSAMKKTIERVGRVNAGFGAWSLPDEKAIAMVKQQAQLPRIRRGEDIEKYMIRKETIIEMAQNLQNFGAAATVVDWQSFNGPYIALVIPKLDKRKRYRFRVTVQNVSSSRGFPICHRVVGVPFISVKFLPPRPLAAGMEIAYELFADTPLPEGEYLGAFILSDQEDGPELFRCPIYIRVVAVSKTPMEERIRGALRRRIQDGSLMSAFRNLDRNVRGIMTRLDFRKALASTDLSEELIQAIVMRIEVDPSGMINYMEFLHANDPGKKLGEDPKSVPPPPPSNISITSGMSGSVKSLQRSPSMLKRRPSLIAAQAPAVSSVVVKKKSKDEGYDPMEAELLAKGRGVPLSVKDWGKPASRRAASVLMQSASPLPRSIVSM